MLFDINTAIGRWPFRQIPFTTAAELRPYLESQGIGRAATASNYAVFYMNPQDANLELARELEGQEDFFVPVATLNPAYAAFEKDIDTCKSLGFNALRLVPAYHGYDFTLPEAGQIVEQAAGLGMPVILPHELVNFRQRHHMEPQAPFNFTDFIEFVKSHPAADFIIMGTPVSPDMDLPANLYVELSRMGSAYGHALSRLIAKIGANHVLYGSGSPLKGVETSLLKLHNADLSGEALELVTHGNAERLLHC